MRDSIALRDLQQSIPGQQSCKATPLTINHTTMMNAQTHLSQRGFACATRKLVYENSPVRHVTFAHARLSSRSGRQVSLPSSVPSSVACAHSRRLKVTAASTTEVSVRYALPSWNAFELGTAPVYWEPEQPVAGETMTIWFNPELTPLREGDYCAFNGGFNGPFMCGGAPRGMAKKARGGGIPLWSIRVNVPRYACFLEFGFTDGKNWDEGYHLDVLPLEGFEGRPMSFFKEGISEEMGLEGACEASIFPDEVPEAVFCKMPMGIGLAGQSCALDIVEGCTSPEAANYDPMANMSDESLCELPISESTAAEK